MFRELTPDVRSEGHSKGARFGHLVTVDGVAPKALPPGPWQLTPALAGWTFIETVESFAIEIR